MPASTRKKQRRQQRRAKKAMISAKLALAPGTGKRDVDAHANGKPVRGRVGCFDTRAPQLNMSVPSILFHIVELFFIITGCLSLINLGIPQALGNYVAPILISSSLLYLIALIVGAAGQPDLEKISRGYTDWSLRNAKYLANDVLHYYDGFLSNFFVTLFYSLWFYFVVNQAVNINPLTDPQWYLGQLSMIIMFTALNIRLFAKYTVINSLAIKGQALSIYILENEDDEEAALDTSSDNDDRMPAEID